MGARVSIEQTLKVRDACLCLHAQRAARALARRFDEALRPFDLTNGQFSLLMALNRPASPTLGEVARTLAMDRTTLTAALKPLARDGLLDISVDPGDRRGRRAARTAARAGRVGAAFPARRAPPPARQAELEAGDVVPDKLRKGLRALGGEGRPRS